MTLGDTQKGRPSSYEALHEGKTMKVKEKPDADVCCSPNPR